MVVHRSGSLPSSFGTPPPVAGRTRGKQPANYRSLRCSPPMPTNKLNAPLPSLPSTQLPPSPLARRPGLYNGATAAVAAAKAVYNRRRERERGAGGRIRKALSRTERETPLGWDNLCLSLSPPHLSSFCNVWPAFVPYPPCSFLQPSSLLIRITMLIEGSKIVRSSPPPDGQVKIIS